MGPGSCNPYPEAVEALARPMLGHLDPELVALLDETCEGPADRPAAAAVRTSRPAHHRGRACRDVYRRAVGHRGAGRDQRGRVVMGRPVMGAVSVWGVTDHEVTDRR
jgi:hypothetical protein